MGNVNFLLLLVYSIAFDTVDHNILLSIMHESLEITVMAYSTVPYWSSSDLPVCAGQITHVDRPPRPSAGHDPRPSNKYSIEYFPCIDPRKVSSRDMGGDALFR